MNTLDIPLVSIIVVTWNRKVDLMECIKSIRKVTYPRYEIIVVDNNSTDGTQAEVPLHFSDIRLICNKKDLFAGGGRNEGIKHANGELLFFLDNDNIVDPEIVSELVGVITRDSEIGIVGPKMYFFKDPKRIWFAGGDINLITSRAIFVGSNEVDEGQHDQLRETGHFPNAFMVRREVIRQIGQFDAETYGMFYEESDFCMRAKRAGFKIMFVPGAKTWHKIPLPSEFRAFKRGLKKDEYQRTYLFARNRIIFMRKYARFIDYFVFLFVFLPLISLYYIYRYCRGRRILLSYLMGVFDGLRGGRYQRYLI